MQNFCFPTLLALHIVCFHFVSIVCVIWLHFTPTRKLIRTHQVDRDTTKIAYMRAAMTSLANIHGITFSFMKNLGGKEKLLAEFPTIKEQVRVSIPQSQV